MGGHRCRPGGEAFAHTSDQGEDGSKRIVRSAAEGITGAQELVAVALEEAREPAL